MKTILVLFSFFTLLPVFSQQNLVENATNYLGNFNYIIENTKKDNGYYYNIVLNDSIQFADTIFRNTSGNPKTLLINANKSNQLLWYIDLEGASFMKSFKTQNITAQLIKFTDTVFQVKDKKIYNPGGETSFCIAIVDSNGSNLNLFDLGHSFRDSNHSSLFYNGYSINNKGNLILSGYQLGSVFIDGVTYYNDTFISKYFVYEMDLSGNVLSFNYLFECKYPFMKISDCIEIDNKLIFETSFDSLVIDSKSFKSLEILGYTLNDLALIIFDKNSKSLLSYSVLIDSFANGHSAIEPVKSNGQTILWSVNSEVQSIKVKDSFYKIDYEHDKVVFLIDINTGQPLTKYVLSNENNSSPFDIDYINAQNTVITFRNPGKYLKIDNHTFTFSTSNVTAFIVIESLKSPKLIYQVSGNAYSFKILNFSESKMEFYVNYFASDAHIMFNNTKVTPKSEISKWRFQSTYYSLENFSKSSEFIYSNLKLYPNPVNNVLNIEFPEYLNAGNIGYTLIVYDISGKVVLNQMLEENIIDLSSLETGVYFIEIQRHGYSYYSKFIKT